MKNREDYVILVDMDDTIVDLLSRWVSFLNEVHGLSVSPEEIIDWDISLFFPTITKEQVFAPLFTDGFWSSIQPKEDAVKYLKMLKDEGYRVIICTSTHYTILREKMEKVLFRHFDFLSWNDVVIAYQKQLLDADFLVDDGVHNLIGGKYKGILMDAPHNKAFNEQEHNIVRAKTWSEVYSYIHKVTEAK